MVQMMSIVETDVKSRYKKKNVFGGFEILSLSFNRKSCLAAGFLVHFPSSCEYSGDCVAKKAD